MSTNHHAKFRIQTAVTADKIDAETGVIRDVALVSVGEARGHELRADIKSLQEFFALISGKSVKAYLNHGDNPKPTDAIGLYSGFYVDNKSEPPVLRASQLQIFRAFKENNPQGYQTLFEMAASGPDAFGLSADFQYATEEAEDGGHPFVRPVHVESFDIVGTPAINQGLFSQKSIDIANTTNKPIVLDNQLQAVTTNPIPLSKMKQVFAHFSSRPKALPLIAKFAADMPDDAKAEDVIAKVELALSADEQAAVVAERDALKAQVADLTSKLAELTPKAETAADEAAQLQAKFSALTADHEKQTGQLNQLLKARGRFGATPVKTGEAGDVKTLSLAKFNLLPSSERNAFMATGGKLSD